MYWKGYSWSLLGILSVLMAICFDRSPEHIFTWLNGLMALLWIFGLCGIFAFAYGIELSTSSFWKYIFWGFMVREGIVTWLCSTPDVWNTWNTGIFFVETILSLMMFFPLYLALYKMAYANDHDGQ